MSEYKQIEIPGSGHDIGRCVRCDFQRESDDFGSCCFAGCPSPGTYFLVPVSDMEKLKARIAAIEACVRDLLKALDTGDYYNDAVLDRARELVKKDA